jgi:predicted nucleic acid-binding protein
MTIALDTSILVAAIIGTEMYHMECQQLIVKPPDNAERLLYSHGITETFSTLTGGKKAFRVPANAASKILEHGFLPRFTSITTITPVETLGAMSEAEARGVRGGGIFDYLHLVATRKAKATRFYTLNVSHFRAFHRAGDPDILHP